VNLFDGEQLSPEFRAINPVNHVH
ncbi:uncharacterized protein METZ01_LOCUS381096, partial [marine metagenome]